MWLSLLLCIVFTNVCILMLWITVKFSCLILSSTRLSHTSSSSVSRYEQETSSGDTEVVNCWSHVLHWSFSLNTVISVCCWTIWTKPLLHTILSSHRLFIFFAWFLILFSLFTFSSSFLNYPRKNVTWKTNGKIPPVLQDCHASCNHTLACKQYYMLLTLFVSCLESKIIS